MCGLQLASPFILRALILFIKDPDQTQFTGIVLVACLTLTSGLSYLINEHVSFYTTMTGAISTNALIAMIYDKIFKISNATNKSFD